MKRPPPRHSKLSAEMSNLQKKWGDLRVNRWHYAYIKNVLKSLLTLAALHTVTDRSLASTTRLDARTVAEVLIVGATRAGIAISTPVAGVAVVLADGPRALAGNAVLVHLVLAGEGGAALPAVVARGVGDEPGAIAVVHLTAVVVEVFAAEAPGAVLAKFIGAEVAVLARRGLHVVGGALAAVVDGHALKPALGARERLHAAALEVADAHRRQTSGARLDALAVEEVVAIAADSAGVAFSIAVAPVAVIVKAPTALASKRPGLDPAAFAGDRLYALALH